MLCALAHRALPVSGIFLNRFTFHVHIKEYCHESSHHAGTTCIADRRGAYSDDAQAAELHRRGIFDRHRHIGTGKMKFPMQRLLSQKINFV